MMKRALPSAKPPEPIQLPPEEIIEGEVPQEDIVEKELPSVENEQNILTIDGVRIEVKPTRLYYQRNGVAGFYRVLQSMPLPYIFQLPDDYFDEKRTPTKCLMDWISCVIDDPAFTKKHFDNMTTADIYALLEAFCRLNEIDKMEEQVKNRMATAAMTAD